MVDTLRIAICQFNPTVGDLSGNTEQALAMLAQAEDEDADLAILPELAITGYSPEDLVLRQSFVKASCAALQSFAAATRSCAAIVGFVDYAGNSQCTTGTESTRSTVSGVNAGRIISAYNAVAVCANGRVQGVYHKRYLPNYGVFDEVRQFRSGSSLTPALFDIAGVVIGITICEDAWIVDGPLQQLAEAGAQLVVNVSSSPFYVGKQAVREEVITQQASRAGIFVVYVNLVGAQDDLVFDGGSFVASADGCVTVRCASFSELVEVFDVDLLPSRSAGAAGVDTSCVVAEPQDKQALSVVKPNSAAQTDSFVSTPVAVVTAAKTKAKCDTRKPGSLLEILDRNSQCWSALVLATTDYVHKNGFTDVAVGLSGGIDSSLVTTLAVDALGSEHVHGILMPSCYSSDHSMVDAQRLADNLKIETEVIDIEPAHRELADTSSQAIASLGSGSVGLLAGGYTDQNIQARIRGLLLMALANEYGWLILTTGNKSELAVGYSTIYGDTAGAYAVIADLWKLQVYELAYWRNRQSEYEIIPDGVLKKPPSAELAPGQRDDQSLPAYEVLDPILRLYVEERCSVSEIQALNIASHADVKRVCTLVDLAEYKRRQSPLGPRLTQQAFGRDRRIPIVNHYR